MTRHMTRYLRGQTEGTGMRRKWNEGPAARTVTIQDKGKPQGNNAKNPAEPCCTHCYIY